MVAQLDLPRAAWTDHPHYPSQTLLLGSHANFRALGQSLHARALNDGDEPTILSVFSWWKSAMRNHERYEEHKLYPYLAHSFGLDIDSMESGHAELSVEDAHVRAAAGRGSEAFADALGHHQRVLLAHLEHEEDVVIPALLALTPERFDAYCNHSLGWLLANHTPL